MLRVAVLLSCLSCTEPRPPSLEESIPMAPAVPVAAELDFADLDPASTASVPIAIERFVARSDRELADLQLLLGFFEKVELEVEVRMRREKAFDDAVAFRLGECDSCDRSAVAAVDEIERDGLRVRRVDGRLIEVDRVALRRQLQPVLPAPALAYYDALIWDEEHVARMLPPSAPDDVARALILWEGVIDAGEQYAAAAHPRAGLVADEYLGLCIAAHGDEPTRCVIDEPMRASYRRFVAERTTSRWHPAVAHYLERARKRRFAMSVDEAIALRDESRALAR